MILTLTLTRQLLPFAVPEGGGTLRAALRFGWLDASLALRLLRLPPPNASRAAAAPPVTQRRTPNPCP